jgi:hypothetical protein
MRVLALTTLCLCVAATPAAAQSNVDFTGTVATICALSLPTNGTLGLNPAGNVLSSEYGLAGSVTVLSIGSNNLAVDAPIWQVPPPAGYNATGEALLVSYSGAAGLSAVNQAFTASDTSVPIGTLAAAVLTVNNRVTNSNGFAEGTYTTRTVVTCTP